MVNHLVIEYATQSYCFGNNANEERSMTKYTWCNGFDRLFDSSVGRALHR